MIAAIQDRRQDLFVWLIRSDVSIVSSLNPHGSVEESPNYCNKSSLSTVKTLSNKKTHSQILFADFYSPESVLLPLVLLAFTNAEQWVLRQRLLADNFTDAQLQSSWNYPHTGILILHSLAYIAIALEFVGFRCMWSGEQCWL